MADATVVPAERVAALLAQLAALSWPIPQDDVPALVTDLGWAVVPGTEGADLEAETDFALNRAIADFSSDKGELTSISFDLTDVVVDETPWRAAFLRDAFADIAAAAIEALGPPSKRIMKPRAKAWWELANGGRITVSTLDVSVVAEVTSARYADVMRNLARS